MKHHIIKRLFVCLILIAIIKTNAVAQVLSDGKTGNPIPTAVPFLLISPDARSAAMGDAGVALQDDANATYWNPSKMAFMKENSSFSLSYSPWLSNIVSDANISYLNFQTKIDDRMALGLSLKYFNLGSVDFTDANNSIQGSYKPTEFSFDASFARSFGNDFSLGLTLKYISSSIFSTAANYKLSSGSSVAAGISFFYKNDYTAFGNDAHFSFGTDISNIGSKISYNKSYTNGMFLPTNLRVGAANTWDINPSNQLTFTVDLNKLLVPTPPVRDASGHIISGKDDNISVPAGIFQSFTDAPGGFTQEVKDIDYSAGLEYGYNHILYLRAGYFYENSDNGGRHYGTLGVGYTYKFIDFDFSYLTASQQNSPLANTLRLTAVFKLGKK